MFHAGSGRKCSLIDFGLARPIRSGDNRATSVTRTGEVLGTADYMAPEQAAGGRVDARADIYSLTVVFYEMLTGTLPRELGSGTGAVESQKRSGQPSAAVLRLVRRGVATDPAKRYQTADELQGGLEQLRLNDVPVRISDVIREAKSISPEELARIESKLVRILGPIARHLVRDASRRYSKVSELCKGLAAQIPWVSEREDFLKAVLGRRRRRSLRPQVKS